MTSSPLSLSTPLEIEGISFLGSFKYCYQLYGLTLRSELRLPQLLSGREQSPVDVVVRYGRLPDALENPADEGINWQATKDEFLFAIPEVGRYWIRQGKEIWIERDPQAEDNDVRTFLLGSAIGMLLHQRQIWALHASAIETNLGAVLFTGPSGAGKSTTLNGMLCRGYAMIADDVSGVVIDDKGCPQVLSAFPHSRLWADTAAQLNLSTEDVPRVRKSLEKFLFPVKNFVSGTFPIYTVYVLMPHNGPGCEFIPITNADRFTCLFSNTYRRRFVQSMGWGAGHFQLIVQALQSIRVVAILRPKDKFLLDELIDRIEADLG